MSLPGPDAVEQIQRLIEVMIDSGAVEVELQDEGQKIRVRLKEDAPRLPAGIMAPGPQPVAPSPTPEPAGASEGPAGDLAEGQELFKSPMVGTFYRVDERGPLFSGRSCLIGDKGLKERQ